MNCKHYLDVKSVQTLKDLAGKLKVTEMAVFKRLYAIGKIQNERKRLPHELSF